MRTGAVTDDRPMTLHATAKLPTDQGRGIAPRRTPPPPWEIVRPPHWPVIEDMHRSKQRILFIAEAVTLAHVARLVGLARSLASDQYEICLACDPRYNDLIGDLPFPVVPVQTIPSAQFFQALAHGRAIYSTGDLIGYVEEELRLFDTFRPDVVVGDFRLSLDISAKVHGTPYVTITNAYWSPYAKLRFPVPDIPLARILGVPLAQKLFDWARPFAFALHALPLNRTRRKYGLASLSHDLRQVYTHADYTLYADIAEIVPTSPLPKNHRFIGPVPWSPSRPPPNWWDSLPADRPIVYVTLGSSGPGSLLPVVLAALADLPLTVIAATAGRMEPGAVPGNARIAEFLPGEQAAERARMVICNGGSPTSYQGLLAGKPIVGIASNLDQYLNMSLMESAGAGMLLRSGKASPAAVRQAVMAVLDNQAMAARAENLKSVILNYRAGQALETVLHQIMGTQRA